MGFIILSNGWFYKEFAIGFKDKVCASSRGHTLFKKSFLSLDFLLCLISLGEI